jgi:uncharacterized HAD superfamily protein
LCQDRYGEQFHGSAHLHRVGVHRSDCVQRAARRTGAGEIFHRAAHRRRDIVKLQVSEDFFAHRDERFEHLKILPAHAKFEAQLVESHRIAKPLDPP